MFSYLTATRSAERGTVSFVFVFSANKCVAHSLALTCLNCFRLLISASDDAVENAPTLLPLLLLGVKGLGGCRKLSPKAAGAEPRRGRHRMIPDGNIDQPHPRTSLPSAFVGQDNTEHGSCSQYQEARHHHHWHCHAPTLLSIGQLQSTILATTRGGGAGSLCF